jgi:hypothetical protein
MVVVVVVVGCERGGLVRVQNFESWSGHDDVRQLNGLVLCTHLVIGALMIGLKMDKLEVCCKTRLL